MAAYLAGLSKEYSDTFRFIHNPIVGATGDVLQLTSFTSLVPLHLR